ncbi:MAG TPA: hypothetical protein VNT79_03695, partial [Phycisphaerae bacterium]|nr:hypothetical protein [Phycisphaerae bacterium]
MTAAIAEAIPNRAKLAGRWQVPSFLVGGAIFAAAIFQMQRNHQPLTFEDHLHRVRLLQDARAFTRLNAYLLHLLQDGQRPVNERAELHRLLAGTIHAAEVQGTSHKSENVQSIITHFDRAAALGAKPNGADWTALGDAYLWMNRTSDAAGAYRHALRIGISAPDEVLRRLVQIQSPAGGELSPESSADIERLLATENARPANYRWAVERRAT